MVILSDIGQVPLPPYINNPETINDPKLKQKYQTVYSKQSLCDTTWLRGWWLWERPVSECWKATGQRTKPIFSFTQIYSSNVG